MVLIDIVLLGIIVIFAIVGLCRGFIKSILSFFKGTTDVVISVVLAKPVASFLTGFKLNEMLANVAKSLNLVGAVVKEEAFNTLLNGGASITGNVISENMSGKVSFIVKTFFSNLFTEEVVYTSYADFCAKFNLACGTILLIVLSFIMIMICLGIILSILTKIFTTSTGDARYGTLDKILGLVFGMLKGLLVIVVIMFALNVSGLIPVVGNAIEEIIADTKITAFIYEKVTGVFTNIVSSIDFNTLIASALQ
ncbi:MAG: CvpA family protein [Clostridia bacterium]|nr:CvpA family protein [Clostridia bacterium]